ncbi:MAG: alpha-1,2-fucosyltransferase [Pseudomonadota bacterium]
MKSVRVKLMGGLGNQLFQYATARALAARHSSELILDTSNYLPGGLRRYELAVYPLSARTKSSYLKNIMQKAFRKTPDLLYREPHFYFDAGLQKQKLPLAIEGYWQSEKYFLDIASALRNEIKPEVPLSDENLRIAEKIEKTNSISLHVRRGDYVTNAHTNAYHGTCSLDYYRRAIDFVQQREKNLHFFIFSDDPEWTKENLALDHDTTFVNANTASQGYFDLELMRRCKHHIIANSSFSWWGAWLNPFADKIVVAPQAWFANNDNDTRDLIPESWVRL